MTRWCKVALVNHAAATAALDTKADLERWYNRRSAMMSEIIGIGAALSMGLEWTGCSSIPAARLKQPPNDLL